MLAIPNQIIEMVNKEAVPLGLDPKVILGIIMVESNFNANAVEFERGFIYLYREEFYSKKQAISKDTEVILQKISWGLMQIMGGTARWLGFDGYLPDLAHHPEIGVRWGVKYFATLAKRYVYLSDQIAAYNAGSVIKNTDGTYMNQKYVSAVLRAIDEVEQVLIRRLSLM